MKLRPWFVGVSLALAGVTLAAALALVLFGHSLAAASSSMVEDLRAARAAEAIELGLNRFRRQELAWYLSHDEARRAARERERFEVERLAAFAISEVGVRYTGAFAAARRSVDAYVATGPTDAPISSVAFLAVQEPLEKLATNVSRDAFSHLAEVSSLKQALDFVALLVAWAVLAITAFVILSLRRRVLQPVDALRRSIAGYGHDGQLVSQPLRGEFGEIQAALIGMANTIAQQHAAQSRFIASVVHDLHAPLTSMKGYCWLARSSRPLRDEAVVRRAFGVIERQVDRLARQLRDLLDRTRVEAGEFELKRVEVDAADVARDSALLFEGLAPGQITVRMTAPLPVTADPDKLHQVLVNLLSNAIKYSPGGGEIVLTGRRDGPDAVLEVADHGIGIPPEELERIFEPYQRGTHGKQLEIAGIGLGLSAAKRILEAHGGRMEVRSQKGRGSTFLVRIPASTTSS